MKFGTKIALLLTIIALVPIGISIVLVELALRAGQEGAKEREQDLRGAIDRTSRAYRHLFESQKELFRAEAVAMAATFHGTIADPERHHVRRWRVLPQGPSGDAAKAFPEERWRAFVLEEALSSGQKLELEFVVPWEWFHEYEAIGTVTQTRQRETLEEEQHSTYHFVFVGMFAAILLPIVGIGVVLARRTSRRLGLLATAAKEVGRGRLDVQLTSGGRDEIADLSAAFIDMVRQIRESRSKIAYLEKIGAWQEVARRLAHEIKNPLTPIQLAVQQLHRKYEGDDPAFRKLLDESNEIVGEEIGTLRRLVTEFSAFSQLPRVEPVELDLGALLADVVRGRPDWEGRVALAQGAPQSLPGRADRQLVKQALVNLIENALQAGARRVEVGCEAKEGHPVRLSVDDDGGGVPAELREKIFEPYFTTKRSGTGLGLPIVKKIALEHGGDVVAEASPLGGARFVLILPST